MKKPRFNPRLHPLLALGLGLGLAVLLFPGTQTQGEKHSDEDILSRLTATTPDPAHSPLFWLGEAHADSDLWRAARVRCHQGLASIHPGCRMLRSVEELLLPLQQASIPDQAVPTAPPPAEPPAVPLDSSPEGDS